MSMLIMATVEGAEKASLSTYAWEPSRPISSPEKATKTTLRAGREEDRARRAATSMSAAVPLALSSAPLWIAELPGASDPAPPRPRWS